MRKFFSVGIYRWCQFSVDLRSFPYRCRVKHDQEVAEAHNENSDLDDHFLRFSRRPTFTCMGDRVNDICEIQQTVPPSRITGQRGGRGERMGKEGDMEREGGGSAQFPVFASCILPPYPLHTNGLIPCLHIHSSTHAYTFLPLIFLHLPTEPDGDEKRGDDGKGGRHEAGEMGRAGWGVTGLYGYGLKRLMGEE